VARDLEMFCLAMMMTYPAFLCTEDVERAVHLVKRWSRRGGDQPS
jgi:hypothetical protein